VKFLLYSDVHLRPERQRDFEIVFESIRTIAREERVKVLINGGDMFHVKGIIKTSVFDFLVSEREKMYRDGLINIDIIGNHDQADRDGKIHPLRCFEVFDGWRVIDDYEYIDEYKMHFLSYTKDVPKALASVKNRKGTDLIAHTGVREAYMNDTYKDEDGVEVDVFKGFRKVWLGHYHLSQVCGSNIEYIGSPMQQSASEAGHQKGVKIFDNKTGKSKFVAIHGTQRYFSVPVTFGDDGKIKYKKPKDAKKNDVVTYKIEGTREQLKSVGSKIKGDHQIKISKKIVDAGKERIAVKDFKTDDHESFIKKYIDHVDCGLDKKKLMSVWKGLR
jgi:DNA repair exonuclease SbcCD nuclease subunit